MRPYILAETNWKQIQETNFDIAILPWGATEAHNYHLPYNTDVVEAEQVAAEAAKQAWANGTKCIVLPIMPFGVNTGQHDVLLCMNLNPTTQLAILKDIITTLNRQGIFKLLIVNAHGGNDFKWMIRELGLQFPKMFSATCNFYQSVDRKLYFDEPGDHADESETSLMLHLAPHLVMPLEQAGNGAEKKWTIKSLQQGWASAERRWTQVTADTGIGNPAAATAEKGKRYFEAVSEKIAVLITEIAESDIDKLYG